MLLNYKDWKVKIDGQLMTVIKNNETREYDLPEYESITVKDEYITIQSKDFYTQFKMEEDSFFVGDKFDNEDDEFIDSVASHVFGEDEEE